MNCQASVCDPNDLHSHSTYKADLAKHLRQHLTEFTTADFHDILDDPNFLRIRPAVKTSFAIKVSMQIKSCPCGPQ